VNIDKLTKIIINKLYIRYIYTGDLCISSFEEACALLKLASSLGLEKSSKAAREFISENMYPHKMWTSLQCAREASDDELVERSKTV
jgi:hypothetical protein